MTERVRQLRLPAIQAAVIQLLILMFCAGFRDGGRILTGAAVASVAFWCCAAVVLLSSSAAPSRVRRLFVGWGLLMFSSVGAVLWKLFDLDPLLG